MILLRIFIITAPPRGEVFQLKECCLHLRKKAMMKESTSGTRQAAYEAKNEADKDFDQNSHEQACKNTGENEIIDEETETVRHNLLEYSKLDTEGLFHIMQELEKLII